MALQAFLEAGRLEAGIDEAGRGCLAGPVVAAAVILPAGFDLPGLDDSKRLSERQRLLLRDRITAQALCWAIGVADNAEIDAVNILQATFSAMHRAVEGLSATPGMLLVDGNRFRPYPGIPHLTVVGGDGRLAPIAAASILAKTHRDALMRGAARQYPGYGWEVNKGYPTREHREAIASLGPTPLHRRSFRLLPDV